MEVYTFLTHRALSALSLTRFREPSAKHLASIHYAFSLRKCPFHLTETAFSWCDIGIFRLSKRPFYNAKSALPKGYTLFIRIFQQTYKNGKGRRA